MRNPANSNQNKAGRGFRNLLKSPGFVLKHDFSRAVNAVKSMRALATEGETLYSELLFQQVLRSGGMLG
jgi:hypothetical protein